MKKIIQEDSTKLLQASHCDITNSISLEQFAKLSDGGHFNIGRISLSYEEVQAIMEYFEAVQASATAK